MKYNVVGDIVRTYISDVFFRSCTHNQSNYTYINTDFTHVYNSDFGSEIYTEIRVIFRYDTFFQNDFCEFKFGRNTQYVSYFQQQLYSGFCELINRDFDYIVYPPISVWKKWKRGYNQSFVLASYIEKISSIPVQHIFGVSIWKSDQSKLSRQERIQSIQGRFYIPKSIQNKCQGKKYLIIDDVISTGATAKELALLLQKAGAKSVSGLFLSGNTEFFI